MAFACPVALRCTNSLLRDGNVHLQVIQRVENSFYNEEKKQNASHSYEICNKYNTLIYCMQFLLDNEM